MSFLQKTDPAIYKLIQKETLRQTDVLEMIPSENYASKAVREAVGSILANKYSEGYSGKRYYQGNKIIDEIETIAVERAKKLFGVPFANVQPHSGSPANTAVYFALLEPGDKIMGLSLASGGHLTHGHPEITFSGKYFQSVQYSVEENGLINFEKLTGLALKERPKLIIAGTTAFPRILEFDKFAKIADQAGALLMADISHLAGLIISGEHPSPVPFADVVTTTTHKTLRGPRGAIIMATEKGLAKDPQIGEKINKAIIPGLQGGPHNNITAAIAVCLKEAEGLEFKQYGHQVVANSKKLAQTMLANGLTLIGGGTDNHLAVIDLRPIKSNGKLTAEVLEMANIVTNRNAVPNDPLPPFYTSGIRLGTPAVTTRGMKEAEMEKIGQWVAEVILETKNMPLPEDREKRGGWLKEKIQEFSQNETVLKIAGEVLALTHNFPTPGISL